MPKPRLSKEDWLAAGFRALSQNGPAALRAEAIARDLGTTKGSFYWHFKDLPSFKSEMLALWRDKAALDIMRMVLAEPDPKARLDKLAEKAAQDAPDHFGGRTIESAIRAWALSDSAVHAALVEVDGLRTDFIKKLLIGENLDPNLATLFYAAFVGLDEQAAKHGADIRKGLTDLITLIRKP